MFCNGGHFFLFDILQQKFYILTIWYKMVESQNQALVWIRNLQYRQTQSIKVGINWIEILIVRPNCSCRISTRQKKNQGNMCSAACPRWLSLSHTLLWSSPKVCRDSPNSTKRTKLYCSRSVYQVRVSLSGQGQFIRPRSVYQAKARRLLRMGYYKHELFRVTRVNH